MFNRIHSKLGTAGFIISIVALVAALGGGAYAASGGLSGKQKKEVEKIAKKYAGKPGAAGAVGPAGPAGPSGAAGPAGAKGDTGGKGEAGGAGSPGTPGANGKSVVTFGITPGSGDTECSGNGGTIVEVEESGDEEVICNGSPWTAGGTLPKGATETGAWIINPTTASGGVYDAVSFPIALKLLISMPKVHYVKASETGVVGCSGNADEPTAAEGTFCIYEGESSEGAVFQTSFVPSFAQSGAGTSGAILKFKEAEAGALVYGSWAVGGS